MGLHKMSQEELVPSPEALSVIGCEEHKLAADAISHDAITLVKSKEEGVLPLNLEKHKRIMIVHVKGAATPMDFLIQAMMGGQGKKTPAEDLRDRLNELGFEAFIYVSPLEIMKQQMAKGEKPSLNLYFAVDLCTTMLYNNYTTRCRINQDTISPQMSQDKGDYDEKTA
jgi:beta-N-acetylhexosaminidase